MQQKEICYQEGKEKFINAWGTLGANWGICRSMAQIHAILLLSPDPLTADQIMEELKIARGNVAMNLKDLQDWGLVLKELRPGERKEMFRAEKDMWTIIKQVILNRKKKELEPLLKVLDQVGAMESRCPRSDEFCRLMQDMRSVAHKADNTLEMLVRADSTFLGNTFLRMVR